MTDHGSENAETNRDDSAANSNRRNGTMAAAKGKYIAARAGYSALNIFAPSAAARRAAKDWCRVPDTAGRRKDNRPYAGTVSQLDGPGGRRMVVESWGSGPIVYLVHGWGGWRGQLGAFVDPLVAQGFTVIGFDTLSHGDSDPGKWGPKHSTGGEMTACFESVAERFGPASGVIAHSLGCAVSTLAFKDGVEFDRAVLIGPSPDLGAAARYYCHTMGLGARAADEMVAEVERMAGRPIRYFDLIEQGADGAMPPTLVIHDRRDKESPYESSAALADAWPTASLHTTEGLGHQRILIDPDVVALATARLAPVN